MSQRPWWMNIWFWWFALTLVYILFFLGGVFDDPDGGILPRLAAFVGLFVPFGFFNFIFSLRLGVFIVALPVLILAMILIENYKKSSNPGSLKSTILNLSTLLVVTFVVDILVWGRWSSWFMLIQGEVPLPLH